MAAMNASITLATGKTAANGELNARSTGSRLSDSSKRLLWKSVEPRLHEGIYTYYTGVKNVPQTKYRPTAKYKPGHCIESLDELAKQKSIMVNYTLGNWRYYDAGWAFSWQFRQMVTMLRYGQIWTAERKTNGEYYAELSDEAIKQKFHKQLCQMCPTSSDIFCGNDRDCYDTIQKWKAQSVE